MYSYLCLKEVIIKRTYNFKIDFTKDKWVWLSFVWTMTTMGSGTALLFMPIVLSKFLKFKNVLFLIIGLIFVIIILNTFGFTAFNRITEVAKAIITLDIDNIVTADHSASIRIVPFFVLLPMLSLTTFDGWFGYGIDYVGSFLYKYIPGVPEGISGGGLFQLWLEYGFISFVIYIVFTLKVVYIRSNYLSLVFWFLLIFMYGVNNQMVWLCLILLNTINFFKKNKNGEFYKNS
jgi:hypothetical protein